MCISHCSHVGILQQAPESQTLPGEGRGAAGGGETDPGFCLAQSKMLAELFEALSWAHLPCSAHLCASEGQEK